MMSAMESAEPMGPTWARLDCPRIIRRIWAPEMGTLAGGGIISITQRLIPTRSIEHCKGWRERRRSPIVLVIVLVPRPRNRARDRGRGTRTRNEDENDGPATLWKDPRISVPRRKGVRPVKLIGPYRRIGVKALIGIGEGPWVRVVIPPEF